MFLKNTISQHEIDEFIDKRREIEMDFDAIQKYQHLLEVVIAAFWGMRKP